VIEQQSGQRPTGLLADSGYCSEKNLAYWDMLKILLPVAPLALSGTAIAGDPVA
jgi:hypothetical protein